MFEKMKDMGNLMKKAKEMKSEMKRIQNELKHLQISAVDKTGLVKVTLTGELECIDISIDPSLKTPENNEKCKKAIMQAFNEASKKAKDTASSKLSVVSQGLNIPGLGG
ncbi:YbaB/EbfC family nucleoid-associated protein [Candidatus Marinamargulisbacteria bacterium SCGC AG-343-D04]|nr:YbaB/EbfC family nucleoid-associated protein [Candidatus Marinamargulisbacteria bacterium SCGC AG-343-D04]